ncbi:MAG TPA: hypothetical protein VE868_05900, partial [Balneolaceae bacterium]|nr:hypothetical protein [Balneolaceae bacterium]
MGNIVARAQQNKQHAAVPDTILTKPQQVTTSGAVSVEGKKIRYHANAGTIILKNNNDKPTCSMFYVAYFKKGDDNAKRPITFIYNGGPGSSSMWLHMAAWGPRRAFLKDTTRVKAPYKTVNNDYSLLDASDLVFIDAPGTGFSRIITQQKGGAGTPKDFYGIDPDAHAFASFITRFLSRYNRWDSPKYLFGESYGTFRSAVLSNILERQKQVDLNGVILLSQLLNYNNMSDLAENDPGEGLPYELALPSAAATAWYYHKLPNQPDSLQPFLNRVEHFAMTDYAQALAQGSQIDSSTFNRIAGQLHQYTSLPVSYIKKANLRISGPEFEKQLLSNEDKVTGRLDTRFNGPAMDPLTKTPEYDPHSATFSSAVVGAFNNYVRQTLHYGKGMHYRPFGRGIIGQWDFRHRPPNSSEKFFANVMPDLASAMTYNPKLKVMLNMGYFDLGTPFFEGEYEMHHLPMKKSLQNNISFYHYKSG